MRKRKKARAVEARWTRRELWYEAGAGSRTNHLGPCWSLKFIANRNGRKQWVLSKGVTGPDLYLKYSRDAV